MKRKILNRKDLKDLLFRHRKTGKNIVFTNGCFDLLHVGHARYLREAKGKGDILVVGVNSDDSVRRLKGPSRPLVPEGDRAEMVAALGVVDYVTVFGEDTPAELIAAVGPDVLVKGGDYRVEEVAGRESVEAAGGRVVIVPLIGGRSTTRLIEDIRGGSG